MTEFKVGDRVCVDLGPRMDNEIVAGHIVEEVGNTLRLVSVTHGFMSGGHALFSTQHMAHVD